MRIVYIVIYTGVFLVRIVYIVCNELFGLLTVTWGSAGDCHLSKDSSRVRPRSPSQNTGGGDVAAALLTQGFCHLHVCIVCIS